MAGCGWRLNASGGPDVPSGNTKKLFPLRKPLDLRSHFSILCS